MNKSMKKQMLDLRSCKKVNVLGKLATRSAQKRCIGISFLEREMAVFTSQGYTLIAIHKGMIFDRTLPPIFACKAGLTVLIARSKNA